MSLSNHTSPRISPRTSRARSLGLIAGAALAAAPADASAQEYLPAASFHAGTGIEGGAGSFQRARTRLRFGLELRIDESPEHGIAAAALVEVEPRSAFGADVRYVRLLSSRIALSAGAMGYLVPSTLLGPCAGVDVRIPLGTKVSLAIGPETAVFALGNDLPNGIVIWQALLQGGFRVDL